MTSSVLRKRKRIKMKSENEHHEQQMKRLIFNAAGFDRQSCGNKVEAFEQNVEKKFTKEACLKITEPNHIWEQESNWRIKHKNRNSFSDTSVQITDSCNSSLRQPVTNQTALKMDSADKLFNGPWQLSPFSDPAGASDLIDRKMSFESIDLELPIPNIDDAPSLDDVFDVLEAEMDFVRPSMATELPLTGPSTRFIDSSHRSWPYDSHQSPNAFIPSSYPCNAFQGFNFGLVKGLQNPSRGLITAIRRLCELLSKPRSDHLDSVFVRLLNETLKEMEAAARPHSRRPRRRSAKQDIPYRQRVRTNKSASDAERGHGEANIRMGRSVACKSQSLPIVSSRPRVDRSTETVDLTALDDVRTGLQRTNNKVTTQNEPFIALEDTMPVQFMGNFI
ncbi:hypothetical protein AWC38_SpisGene1671 [Stylophora pistillata]|uniref:Uncharacterized protein n=1 Tax=Stylophora pistillata TaxID=50429 RepID=A0A2B4SX79_STYPI|nr:hypothetical protein AWC38_SpisGene1671 [Stylophora pistillata]